MGKSYQNIFVIYLKGLTMGAADLVPGVSGGTIALITHIYERLIRAIDNVSFTLIKQLFGSSRQAAWKALDGSFLLSLALGIGTSILLLSGLIEWLLQSYPIPLWAFFFGLILGSSFILKNSITRWKISTYAAFVVGIVVAFGVGLLAPSSGSESLLYLFFCGMLIVIAMILPGISGAFILVLLGAYETALETVSKLKNLDPDGLLIFVVMASGGLIGLKLFSKGLNWLFSYHKNTVLAAMTGFLIGSLYKVWPWKLATAYFENSDGVLEPLTTKAILPQFGNPSQLLEVALICFGLALLILFSLEKMSKRNANA
jgi:putative membrane protein